MEPDEQNLALSQGLLGLGAGLLSGSFGHYGAFAPALGSGVQGFNQGYGNALQRQLQLKQLKMQQDLQTAQIGNYNSEVQKRTAEIEAQKQAEANAKGADQYALSKRGMAPVVQSQGLGGDISSPVTVRTPMQNGVAQPDQMRLPDQGVLAPPVSPLQDPTYHEARAEYLLSKGDRKGATEAIETARKLRSEERALSKDDLDKPLEGVPGVTFNAKTGTYREDGKIVSSSRVIEIKKELAKAGATNVVTNVSTEKKYGEAFAGKIAADDAAYRDAAIKAPDLAQRANSVKQVLATGKVLTGSGADYRLALGKALGLVGASDQETITNTETLATSLAQNTLDAIKASGLGSGNGFSNADRDFLEKAVGGKITLEAGTISRLADLAHRAATKSAEKWNNRVKMIPDSALEGTGLTKDPVEVPPLFSGKSSGNGALTDAERQELEDLRKRFGR